MEKYVAGGAPKPAGSDAVGRLSQDSVIFRRLNDYGGKVDDLMKQADDYLTIDRPEIHGSLIASRQLSDP
jgi:hypothetical protein